jgi:sugar phosphate isomerase/epimerase
MIKIGMCTIAFAQWEVERAIDLAAEVGFEGVEIWGKPPHMPEEFDADHVVRVRERCAANGLQINSFGSYIRPLMDGFAQHSEHALCIARGLGARTMRIWPTHGKPGTLSPHQYGEMVGQLMDLCDHARDIGVRLAFEFHDNCVAETTSAMLRLLNDVGHANLWTYWQPSFRDGAEDFYDSLDRLMPFLVTVHAQNFRGSYKTRTPLAEGDVDYARVARMLKDAEFEGYVEVEFVGDEEPVEWLRKDCEFLKSVMQSD